MKKTGIILLSAAFLAVLFPSCLSIDPSSLRDIEAKDITLEELVEMFESEEALESEEVEIEEVSLEELETMLTDETTGETEEASSEEPMEEKALGFDNAEEPSATAATSAEETYEKVEAEGVSIMTDGVMMPIDDWLAAQEITEESASLKAMDFVEAASLPIEATGNIIEPPSEITADTPAVIEEKPKTYMPAVALVSTTVEDTEAETDILAEYEKFLAELGDDYTEAEGDEISLAELEELFAVAETPITSDTSSESESEEFSEITAEAEEPENDIEKAVSEIPEAVEGVVEDISDEGSTEEEILLDVPEPAEENENFFARLWNTIKDFFVNLWSSIKEWMEVMTKPGESAE